jgi:hypothetical protein
MQMVQKKIIIAMILLSSASLVLSRCSSSGLDAMFTENKQKTLIPDATFESPDYRLGSWRCIQIHVWRFSELSNHIPIKPRVAFPSL